MMKKFASGGMGDLGSLMGGMGMGTNHNFLHAI
jgi:hypothetical protein